MCPVFKHPCPWRADASSRVGQGGWWSEYLIHGPVAHLHPRENGAAAEQSTAGGLKRWCCKWIREVKVESCPLHRSGKNKEINALLIVKQEEVCRTDGKQPLMLCVQSPCLHHYSVFSNHHWHQPPLASNTVGINHHHWQVVFRSDMQRVLMLWGVRQAHAYGWELPRDTWATSHL